MEGKIFFFGAGKIGQRWLAFCKDKGFVPDGFIDNSVELWGKDIEGVPVYPLREITDRESRIYITCRDWEVVYRQLLEQGVEKRQIAYGYHLANELFYRALQQGGFSNLSVSKKEVPGSKPVLMDLQNGMVLGGVESWSYAMAERLRNAGYEGVYLANAMVEPTVHNSVFRTEWISYQGCKWEADMLDVWLGILLRYTPCTVICNFAYYALWAACILKQCNPDSIRIIAVHHNDEQYYFDMHSLWKYYIDEYFVISNRMEEKLFDYGLNRDCIKRLQWEICCEEHLNRNWYHGERELRIGYAGRITGTQKRTELLMYIARKLKGLSCRFHISIAGTGDQMDYIRESIIREGLQEQISLLGFIDRERIPDFWHKQDIMVSCSEWEGHSISQSEAMAAGAVPVITDVSGARDDVTDGYNGFVVDVDDIDGLADKIYYLYRNYPELAKMGIRAHATICERQKGVDQTLYWDNLLKSLWRLQK